MHAPGLAVLWRHSCTSHLCGILNIVFCWEGSFFSLFVSLFRATNSVVFSALSCLLVPPWVVFLFSKARFPQSQPPACCFSTLLLWMRQPEAGLRSQASPMELCLCQQLIHLPSIYLLLLSPQVMFCGQSFPTDVATMLLPWPSCPPPPLAVLLWVSAISQYNLSIAKGEMVGLGAAQSSCL